MVTRRIRRTGGSRLSRPRAARVHCAPGTGGSRLSRPRAARVHCAPGTGGSRLSRPRAARHVHGNAIGRTGRRGRRPLPRHHMVTRRIRRTGGSRLSRPRAARVHCVPGRRSRQARPSRTAAPRTRDRASCTGGRTCTDASRRGSGLNDYPNIDTCILIREVLYSSASSRGRGAVTNKEGQADGQRRADREAGGGRGRRGT